MVILSLNGNKMKQQPLGQALLIIVLVVAVGLTIGIAAVSRSVTNLRISTEQEESARAFSAAEAGIERTLTGVSVPSDLIEGFNLIVQEKSIGGEADFVFQETAVGDTKTIWLIGHDDLGELDPSDLEEKYSADSIEVYWGNNDTAGNQDTTPAIEAVVLYKDVDGVFKVNKFAIDPNTGKNNGFDDVDASGDFELTSGDQTFTLEFFKTLTLPPDPAITYALRLKLIYNNDESHLLGVRGTEPLPLQGKCVESTATAKDSGVTRKAEQCQFYKTPPAIFDYVLYSEGSLAK